ncbi:MAG: hypothetical protein M3Z95_02235 [Actinomycetota bacterium]|nr:hypothetical protein [Actinomycetota bacterium]
MHRSPRARQLVLALVLSLALATPAAVAHAQATIHYTHESLQAYEQQLAGGQITAATFNKRIRTLHLTLTSGQHMLVHYGRGEQPKLAAALAAKGVHAQVLKPAAAAKEAAKVPVKHKLRYIAGGILVAVIVIVGAVLLVNRRRQLRD